MQSVSSRIWTRVAVSISYDDNHYTTAPIYVHREQFGIKSYGTIFLFYRRIPIKNLIWKRSLDVYYIEFGKYMLSQLFFWQDGFVLKITHESWYAILKRNQETNH